MRLFSTFAALLILALIARTGAAQDRRLTERLDSTTAVAVQSVVDSARREGLPTEPLVQKALEGHTLGASGDRIVTAVGALRGQLHQARQALGDGADDADLTAAAGALRAGLSPAALHRLQSLRGDRPLVVPIAVLTDLVAEGVPPEEATRSVLDLARDGKPDAEFMALRRQAGASRQGSGSSDRPPLQPAADPPVPR
jgi:hypothetical protein